ncbi:putative UPF0544 protein C5orf45 homolog [Trypoxylus dichotomus]
MSQELHVVRCYSCETFQVDIIKKVPKWICKMCGEKQSVKKVYAKGTGKECREFVKDLNRQRLSLPIATVESSSITDLVRVESEDEDDDIAHDSSECKQSKWSKYIPQIENSMQYENKENMCDNEKYDIPQSSEWFSTFQNNFDSASYKEGSSDFKNLSDLQSSENNRPISSVYSNKFGDVSDLDVDLNF